MQNHINTSGNQAVGDAIITRNVTLRFGVTIILDDVSFSTKYRGVTVLVGPSGCGKTMLLRSLVGLQRIDYGTITLLGMSLVAPHALSHTTGVISKEDDLNRLRSRVGLVFQDLFLWPYKSVLENIIEAPIAVRGESRKMAETHAMELLDLVGLAHRAKALPRHLSGGEQQRVAVVRALAMKPELLLLDEITSALDPELVVDVLDLIRDLLKWNMTFLIVTHEMWFAQEVADQILFMDKGRILENSEPTAFFHSPSTARARDFLRRVHIISPKLE